MNLVVTVMLASLAVVSPTWAQQSKKLDFKSNTSVIIIDREEGHFELTDGSQVIGYKLKPNLAVKKEQVWFQPCRGAMKIVPATALQASTRSCDAEPKQPPGNIWGSLDGFTVTSKLNEGSIPNAVPPEGKLVFWSGLKTTPLGAASADEPATIDCTDLPPAFRAAVFSVAGPLETGTLLAQGDGGKVDAFKNFAADRTSKASQHYAAGDLRTCTSKVTMKAFPIADPTLFGLQAGSNLYGVLVEE